MAATYVNEIDHNISVAYFDTLKKMIFKKKNLRKQESSFVRDRTKKAPNDNYFMPLLKVLESFFFPHLQVRHRFFSLSLY